MSDDRREIALQALRAAGHDQAAELVAAIIPGAAQAPAAETPAVPAARAPAGDAETPGQRYVREQAEQQAAQGEAFALEDFDAMSAAEQRAFALTDAGDAAITAALRRGEG